MYELFIEGQKADIDQNISILLSYAVDDINDFSSRNTSFSKTIVLPGTANNNRIFGHTHELGSFNNYSPGASNVGINFNVAQVSIAEIRYNGLLMVKGIFRLTQIVKDGEFIEYEGSIFGELAGFTAAIGNKKLEDLDFSEYNHEYNTTNIIDSWGTITKNKTITFVSVSNRIQYYSIINESSLFSVGQIITITGSNNNDGNYTITSITYSSLGNKMYIFVSESLINETKLCTISWGGLSGYYYPLIDYGNVSTNKIDYKFTAFRPALFVKDYIDKMFVDAGYTYESEFFETNLFKSLIIPLNAKRFERLESNLLDADLPEVIQIDNDYIDLNEFILNGFTESGNIYTYTSANTIVNIKLKISGSVKFSFCSAIPSPKAEIQLKHNDINIKTFSYNGRRNIQQPTCIDPFYSIITTPQNISIDLDFNIDLNTNDTIGLYFYNQLGFSEFTINSIIFKIESITPVYVEQQIGDDVIINNYIPKNILQKDFFTWIMKMFNLYVDEDKLNDKRLIIKPYKDYYDLSTHIDWTYKIARDKPITITPMGMLNGRFIECKYKTDNDFYNESYQKRFNLSYGDNLFDTGAQFAKDSQKIEIGFSPTVLLKYDGTDKAVSAILKKSGGNNTQEDPTDSNIRILYAKKIEGVTSWNILDTDDPETPSVLENNLTAYGYAGHVDDPINPALDLNFGVPNEIYFNPDTLSANTLFNVYWSGYIAEIADKDSKLIKVHAYLNALDIAQLDFSKPVFIDGVTWRINKVEDYDAANNELVKVELLKIIDNG